VGCGEERCWISSRLYPSDEQNDLSNCVPKAERNELVGQMMKRTWASEREIAFWNSRSSPETKSRSVSVNEVHRAMTFLIANGSLSRKYETMPQLGFGYSLVKQ